MHLGRGDNDHARDCATMPGWVSAFAPQLFSFDRVRCTKAIRPRYFLIRQGEMGRAKGLKDEVLGSKGELQQLSPVKSIPVKPSWNQLEEGRELARQLVGRESFRRE